MVEQATGSAPEARGVASDRGIGWWSESWALFTKNAGMWIVLGLVFCVILLVLGFIPFLGSIATSLLLPAFMGGWMITARKVEGGGTIEVGDLFAGFKDKLNPLLVLGALLLAAGLVIVIAMSVLGFGAALGVGLGGASNSTAGVLAGAMAGLLALLVGLALSVPVGMALWFAPALVVFDDVAPIDAAKASFAASLRNIVPSLIYGIVMFLACIVAAIPFGLGFIVLVPVAMLSVYVSYREVFARA
jgi:uncharacterized membrane protein